MSKIPERIMFLHPGIYSSDKFRVKHIILKPSNLPSSKNYYTSGDSITWNIGGAPNQFIVPESAHLCFQACVSPTDVIDALKADPHSTAGGGYAGYTPYGLPRIDYGLPFFDQINVTLDSSRNIVNINGASLCKAYLNGRIACSATSFTVEPTDFIDGDCGIASGDKCSASGPACGCGFLSNTRRVLGYSGMYRNRTKAGADNANDNTRFGIASGAVNYKVPLSLFTGLLDPYASSYLPIGMLAQSSASGVSLQLRLTSKENCIVDSKTAKSLNPVVWWNDGKKHGLIRTANTQTAPDGTLSNVAYNPGDAITAATYYAVPAAFANADEAHAEMERFYTYLNDAPTSMPITDGVGAKVASCFFSIFEPVLVYKVVEVLDENLLNLMRASFNGQNVENIELGGQMLSVPRLLNIKYRSFNLNQRLLPTGVTSVTFNISCTEPSLVANMIRIAPQSDEGLASSETKAIEPANVFITKYQVKIGNSVYPLTPVETVRRSKPPTVPNGLDIPGTTTELLKAFTAGAENQMSAIQEDARQIFSPWYDVDNSDNLEDLTMSNTPALIPAVLSTVGKGFRQIKPKMISFQNHSSYEHERLDNSATGIDMRGIGSYNLELEIWEESTGELKPPTVNYNVFIVDAVDAILSVKRNAVDPSYQYAVY